MIHRLALALVLTAAAPAAADTAAPGLSVRVTQDDGFVMPIAEDVASVLIANPDIANVQPLSDRALFLYGKAVGATRLFVLNAEDEIVLERRVVVTRSLQSLDADTRSVTQ